MSGVSLTALPINNPEFISLNLSNPIERSLIPIKPLLCTPVTVALKLFAAPILPSFKTAFVMSVASAVQSSLVLIIAKFCPLTSSTTVPFLEP